ncbi:5-oxoprolinase subunit PxpB [Maribacter thermophilus]|uniref:5-oxoprolinase subunit PxpB n=1 Tax=Maribacter thermophilus TaxID=1197874 RepID=UPI0006412390|nr:5-oxoprolinase subunit PxpB [Maribacter thermophilus]
MNHAPIKIKPYGEHAILIEWPNMVDENILDSIILFDEYLKTHCLPKGIWETVTAYNSLLVVNQVEKVDYITYKKKIGEWYANIEKGSKREQLLWKLPVLYDLDFGIDLEEVAQKAGKTVSEVIELHTSHVYTVYGIGFLPGFMYLGGLPKELEVSRKSEPRLQVKKGSVGIAGKQTGIYPQDSPGGWNIIGSCPIPIFDINKEDPCFVSVGDKIQFQQITLAEYNLHKIETEVGIYKPEKIVLNA